TEELSKSKANLETLNAHWTKEKEVVTKIIDLKAKLHAASAPAAPAAADEKKADKPAADAAAPATPAAPPVDREALLTELRASEAELASLQGESPLVFPKVDAQAVAAVIADWTGIPVGRMVKNEIQALLSLADTLEKRVVGQRHGLEAIA